MKVVVYYNGETYDGDCVDMSNPDVCEEYDNLKEMVSSNPNSITHLRMEINGSLVVFPKGVLEKSIIKFVDYRSVKADT